METLDQRLQRFQNYSRNSRGDKLTFFFKNWYLRILYCLNNPSSNFVQFPQAYSPTGIFCSFFNPISKSSMIPFIDRSVFADPFWAMIRLIWQ